MQQLNYLERIQYQGTPTVSIETLAALQKTHLLHVPFENLDIHEGKIIELQNSYDKIVAAGRGGFCYELNGLFYELLRDLGFAAKLISARVYDKRKGFGPEFDHMAIIVTLPVGRYLVDVGFGDFVFAPLKIELDAVQTDHNGEFVITKHDDHYLAVKKFDGEKFIPDYIFTETERQQSEFLAMCHHHQTSGDSHFTQKRLCSLPTPSGRLTITGNRLLIKDHTGVAETVLETEKEFRQALVQHFKITL